MSSIENEIRPEHQGQVHKGEIIQKCTIEHLSTEILTIILLHTDGNHARRKWDIAAQEMRREGRSADDIIDVLGHRPLIAGYGAPRNFPYNIAGVCNQWREMLSIYPTYWTELSILADSDEPTPLSQLKLYLEYSKKLSLRFFLERRNKYSDELQDPDPQCEKRRVRGIIDILKPHLHRCTSIQFDVFCGSALPSFSHDLRALSRDLEYITLECNTDDRENRANVVDSNNADEAIPEPIWPKLDLLHLFGYTIIDALKHAPTLLTQKRGEVEFEIYRGDAENEDYFLSLLHRVFSSADAPGPHNLTFKDVSVPLWRVPPESRVSWNVRNLYIENSFEMFLNLHKNVDFNRLSLLSINYEDCDELELPADMPPFPPCDVLILTSITNDLRPFLSQWNGSELELMGCHKVGDEFIHYLTDRKANAGTYNHLIDLKIFCSDWEQPSPDAIMELAMVESPAFTDSDGTYYPPNKISVIDIQNWDSELLDDEDIQRLERDFDGIISWSCNDGGGIPD